MTTIQNTISASVLCPGSASGPVMALGEPLSFWGGLEPKTGEIIDRWHPDSGKIVTGTVLLMTSGRGSSSGATVIAEAIRLSTGPVAIVLAEPDAIVTVGVLVAEELYGLQCPTVVVSAADYERCAAAKTLDLEVRDGVGRITLG